MTADRVSEARRIAALHNEYKSDPGEPWAAMILELCDSHELLRTAAPVSARVPLSDDDLTNIYATARDQFTAGGKPGWFWGHVLALVDEFRSARAALDAKDAELKELRELYEANHG